MKNFFLVMAFMMMLAFIGCGKDGEPAADALSGTTWASSYGGSPLAVSFNAGGIVILNMGSETYTGTYTYNNSNVAIQMSIDGRNVTFTGTYSNGTLNISSSEYGSFVFTQTGGPSPDESDESEPQEPDADVKLVKQIKVTETRNSETHIVITEFEYDAYNRVSKVYEKNDENDENASSYTYLYNGNKLIIHYDEDGDEYSVILNTKGYIQSIDDWEYYEYDDDGYLIQRHDEYENSTYTWSDGNLVSISQSDYYNATITYDNSLILVPTSINLLHIQAEYAIEHDDYWLASYGVWGRQCRNLPVSVEVKTGEGNSYTATFNYELNDDGSIAKITQKEPDTDWVDTYEFIYY